jgi:formylglycine-generating enzyme required for sulfatase activity
MKSAALGRADLIRWAARLDDARLGRLAESLGYRERPEPENRVESERAPVAETATPGPTVAAGETGQVRHRQFRVVERRAIAAQPSGLEPPTAPEPEQPVAPLGPPPPLIPWPRLWPLLHSALGELAERNRIDLPRLVAACSCVKPLRRLPRLKGQRWATQGQLILDLHPRLYPFWNDFNALKTALPRLRGVTGLEILRMDQGPDGPVQPWEGGGWGVSRSYASPAADIPVLILGDLGCLGTQVQCQAWIRLGRRLAGSGRLPVALTPCPPRWWDPGLAGLYFPVALDRSAHIPPRPTGPRPWPAQAPDPDQAIQGDPGVRRLLTLLSACTAIRPALLRHLRHLLPADLADAGSEAAAWLHPAFVAGDFALLPGDPTEIERLRGAFAATGDKAERQLAWGLIRAQQEEGARLSDRMEERVLYAAMRGRTDPEAESFLDRVAEALDRAEGSEDAERTRYLVAWVNRRAERMHPDAWACSPSSEVLWLKANPRAEDQGAVLPPGYDLHRALAAAGRPERLQDWRLVQRGEALEIEPIPAPDAALASGSPVVDRFRVRRSVAQVREDRSGAPESSLPLEDGAALALNEAGWRLRTDFEELVIAPMERPLWAHTMGRDRDGLFVTFDDGRGDRRAYWCNPWQGDPERIGPHYGPLRYPGDKVSQGFYVDEAQFRALRATGLFPVHPGGPIAIDDHGVRVEIEIKGVTQGFRWIFPGHFLMGSPKSEEGRFDDETQHEVILTRGFWLAETACTQALWEAVMGKNPSYSKGPQRPVEQVSWYDAQRFIERLNAELAAIVGAPETRTSAPTDTVRHEGVTGPRVDPQPEPPFGMRFRLPTEAEWEYACRAGRTSAYAFGDVFDPKLANNGSETVDVRSLPPNSWGLHEMHGNVREWCHDWFADYSPGPVIDPAGPGSGGGRVLRGGGWVGEARVLRSARRYRYTPSDRRHAIGFRLALAPDLGQARPVGESQTGSGDGWRAVRPRRRKGNK